MNEPTSAKQKVCHVDSVEWGSLQYQTPNQDKQRSTMQCARCLFGSEPPTAPAPYASVLYLGKNTATSWKKHGEWAQSNPLFGVSAYCTRCCKITWTVAQGVDAHAALLYSVMARRRQEVAEKGMEVFVAGIFDGSASALRPRSRRSAALTETAAVCAS